MIHPAKKFRTPNIFDKNPHLQMLRMPPMFLNKEGPYPMIGSHRTHQYHAAAANTHFVDS
jgi:hypothetical protein